MSVPSGDINRCDPRAASSVGLTVYVSSSHWIWILLACVKRSRSLGNGTDVVLIYPDSLELNGGFGSFSYHITLAITSVPYRSHDCKKPHLL